MVFEFVYGLCLWLRGLNKCHPRRVGSVWESFENFTWKGNTPFQRMLGHFSVFLLRDDLGRFERDLYLKNCVCLCYLCECKFHGTENRTCRGTPVLVRVRTQYSFFLPKKNCVLVARNRLFSYINVRKQSRNLRENN